MAAVERPSREYTVLARRCRPQAFEEVIGQEHVAQALRNSIRQGRVAHAYLFTGARGVGKTSTARILAKSLNCPHAVDGSPCQTCEICQGISSGGDVDVLEIDGASNRGIEDIRTLRQNVNVRSMRSKYKIYIIDEVHMLTKEAFNALLKTLEEPPPNVKFVFCTTEPNKIPDTILSRCQRYDFGTIATASIKGRLAEIAKSEGKTVDDGALDLVARRAAGSMRDSQSLFDQLLAFGDDHIRTADVHRILGTAPDDRLIGLMQAAMAHQPNEVLCQFHEILEQGVQLAEFTDQLLNYTRDLLIVASGAFDVPLQSVGPDNLEKLKTQATAWGFRNIVAAMQILADTKGKMRGTTYGRALTELALVRLTLLEDLSSIEQVITALRSGAIPVASVSRPGSMSNTSSNRVPPNAAPPGQEKKNDPLIEQSERPIQAEPIQPSYSSNSGPTLPELPKIPDRPKLELRSGEESAFLTQVLLQLTGLLRDNLKLATAHASSGPNQLVLAFEKRYDLARQYCERNDNLVRLREVLALLTGHPITVTFRTTISEAADRKEVAEAAQDSKLAQKSKSQLDQESRVIPDRFVQKVAEIFHGKIGEPTPLN